MNPLQIFFGFLGLCFAAYVAWPTISSGAAWLWSKRPTGGTSATVPTAKAGEAISAEQAMASIFLLSRYVATQSGSPEFEAVKAALKTLESK